MQCNAPTQELAVLVWYWIQCVGRARKCLIEEGKRLGEPARHSLQRAFHSKHHCYTQFLFYFFLQNAYQWTHTKCSHSSSVYHSETQQMIQLWCCHAVIFVPQQPCFVASAKTLIATSYVHINCKTRVCNSLILANKGNRTCRKWCDAV